MAGLSMVAWKGVKALQRVQKSMGCWSVQCIDWGYGFLLMHAKTGYTVHIKYMPHGYYVSGTLTYLLGAIPYNTGVKLIESHTFQYRANIYHLYREQFCKGDHEFSPLLLLE